MQFPYFLIGVSSRPPGTPSDFHKICSPDSVLTVTNHYLNSEVVLASVITPASTVPIIPHYLNVGTQLGATTLLNVYNV